MSVLFKINVYISSEHSCHRLFWPIKNSNAQRERHHRNLERIETVIVRAYVEIIIANN